MFILSFDRVFEATLILFLERNVTSAHPLSLQKSPIDIWVSLRLWIRWETTGESFFSTVVWLSTKITLKWYVSHI